MDKSKVYVALFIVSPRGLHCDPHVAAWEFRPGFACIAGYNTVPQESRLSPSGGGGGHSRFVWSKQWPQFSCPPIPTPPPSLYTCSLQLEKSMWSTAVRSSLKTPLVQGFRNPARPQTCFGKCLKNAPGFLSFDINQLNESPTSKVKYKDEEQCINTRVFYTH